MSMSEKGPPEKTPMHAMLGLLDMLISGNPFRLFDVFKFKKTTNINKSKQDKFEETPLHLALAGYISYMILFVVAWIRELLFGMGPVRGDTKSNRERNREGYAPLFASFESFYTRNVYRRLKDTFHQPISSVPGAKVTLVDRVSDDDFWTFRMIESRKKECINLGSYNYLGFAENHGKCTDQAIDMTRSSGLTQTSPRQELGTMPVHKELEETVAKFLGTEAAITVGMGFATNTLNLPMIMNRGCLVLSDELNHASIILGLRLSGATVCVFKHNNVDHLEKVLKANIVKGHPRTRRPWRKVFIVVEGVYSMEGSVVKLPEMVAVKKKYGAYLYLDEAHSVGAMGPRGRGVIDYYGLNPKDIDILMGTFTKSFGSAGGYISGSKTLIDYLRIHSQAFVYPSSMSPPVAQQIITAMKSITDGDGLLRVKQLAQNSRYFRQRLKEMGFIVYGHDDSPVVPMLLFMPAKIRAFVLECLKYNVATVGVGFPATKMTEERARFCMSAGHTKEMIDEALDVIDKVGDHIHIKYAKKM
jgi:serine palmitoyltransferase